MSIVEAHLACSMIFYTRRYHKNLFFIARYDSLQKWISFVTFQHWIANENSFGEMNFVELFLFIIELINATKLF